MEEGFPWSVCITFRGVFFWGWATLRGRCQAIPSKKGSTDSYQEGPGRWPLAKCGTGVCVPGTVLRVPEGAVMNRASLGSCRAYRLVGKQLIVQRTEKEREQRRPQSCC